MLESSDKLAERKRKLEKYIVKRYDSMYQMGLVLEITRGKLDAQGDIVDKLLTKR